MTLFLTHWIITINGKMGGGAVSYWHTTAKDRNNWLKTIFFAGENTSVLISDLNKNENIKLKIKPDSKY